MAFEDPTHHPIKVAADLVAAASPITFFFSWLPTALSMLLTVLSIIYFALQIGDHPRFQRWWARRRFNEVDRLDP